MSLTVAICDTDSHLRGISGDGGLNSTHACDRSQPLIVLRSVVY